MLSLDWVSEYEKETIATTGEAPEIPWSTIWNIQREIGGSNRTFATDTRGVSTLARYLSIPTSTVLAPSLNLPELSPDLLEYAYIIVPAAGNRGQVRVGDAADINATVLLAENPSGGAAGPPSGGTQIIGWSPDSAQVYYRGINNNTDRDGEIWVVNRDGTGDTLLFSSATLDGVAWGALPRISPDGTMIAFWIDQDAPTAEGLWVMDSDGTNDNRIYTREEGGEFYGWSRDSEWLLFVDEDTGTAPDTHFIYKIRPDGTDLTTLYQRSEGVDPVIGLSLGQNSVWLPDSSGVLCVRDTGSGAPQYEVGILEADGSETFTAFSPQRLIYSATGFGPIYSDGRAFFLDGDRSIGTSFVVSTLVDGSDFRIDDDMTDSSTTPQHDDYVFNGFHNRLG